MVERNASQESIEQKQHRGSKSREAIERRSQPRGLFGLGFSDFLLDPYSAFRGMYDEMNRIMERSGNRTGSSGSFITWIPTIEVEQRDDKYIVSAELPGISEADVHVEVDNDVLVIQGQRQQSRDENENGVRRTERRYGQFYRSIPFPEGADPNQAEAKIDNGVLVVTFAMAQQQVQKKQIPITTTSQNTEPGKLESKNKGTKAA